MSWPRVPLKELLKPISRPEPVQAERTYRLLGAHWYASGLYVKETCPGSEIRAARLYRVEEGDFVYNRLFAWKGSFAVATHDVAGCCVSNEFPCFSVDRDRLEAAFLWRYFSREKVWSEALGLSTGGTPTSRNRLKEERLLAMTIPLPPLDEQRRIAERLDCVGAKIQQAASLNQRSRETLDKLLACAAHRPDTDRASKLAAGWRECTLGELLHEVSDDRRVKPDRTYPNLGIFSFGRGLFRKPPINGARTSATTLKRVTAGQFIYSRLFAFEGAYGMVTADFDGCFVSNEYPTFECDPELRVEFLAAFFKAPHAWSRISANSKGLGDRRQRVQPGQLLAFRLLVPPMPYQTRIAAVMQRFAAILPALCHSGQRLEALLPSIADRAFRAVP